MEIGREEEDRLKSGSHHQTWSRSKVPCVQHSVTASGDNVVTMDNGGKWIMESQEGRISSPNNSDTLILVTKGDRTGGK